MSTIDDGGPAFARPGANWKNADGQPMGNDACLGMSLRDYVAIKAMHGLLSMSGAKVGNENMTIPKHEATVADTAYSMADAMLKAREQKGSTQ